jgi:hypothetical protein
VLGEKRSKPRMRDVLGNSLAWALQVMRTPSIGAYGPERHNGIAAYQAWANHLRRDGHLDTDDGALLRQRYMAHDAAVSTVAEGRWYGGVFMRQMARYAPEVGDELRAAADCLKAEHDLMWDVWHLVDGPGHSDAHVRRFAEPATRRKMMPIILEAREKDSQAAAHLERALGGLAQEQSS